MPVSTRISVVKFGAGDGISGKYCSYTNDESDIDSRTIHDGSELCAQKPAIGQNRSTIVYFEILV